MEFFLLGEGGGGEGWGVGKVHYGRCAIRE